MILRKKFIGVAIELIEKCYEIKGVDIKLNILKIKEYFIRTPLLKRVLFYKEIHLMRIPSYLISSGGCEYQKIP